jgi:hypothetical protein
MKRILLLIFIIAATCNTALHSQPLELPDADYSLLSNSQNEREPIEINVNFVPDGQNSKLEIGIVCNKTLGEQTLYTNIANYGTYENVGAPNWFENYIKTQWKPTSALMSFPSKEGMTIDCKEGAIYHFEYKFNWLWEGTYNSIFAFAYIQNPESKEILQQKRSDNILYSEFKSLALTNYLTVDAGKNSYSDFGITNPTKENITYEIEVECSNIAWQIALDRYIVKVPAGFTDTITLNSKTTPRTQYGTITMTVTPKYLKNQYSVPESRTITKSVITNGISVLGITSENIPSDFYFDSSNPWYSFIRGAFNAQPDIGRKTVFINCNTWQTNFPDIDYDILYVFAKSDINTGWATTGTLEKAALDCIDKGKHLIVSSNVGLSIDNGQFENYKATPKAKEFYDKLGIEYKGFIDLRKTCDTLTFRIVNKHTLNSDITDSNTTVNSGLRISKRVDYIGINGENKETFPFLWYNRKKEPPNSYAAVASIIGNSKIIYLAPGLETIGDVGDTLLVRNFMKWFNTPKSVVEIKKSDELTLYPNPANQYIEFSTPPDEFQIYNSFGENVSCFTSKQGKRIMIDNLSAGSYFCLIRTGDKTISKSFIIRR